MTIDVFTLVAQVVNFVILLLLLRRFLYGPIVHVMEEREARIADAHDRAEKAQADAEAEAQRLAAERAELERTKNERLARIDREADAHRGELLEAARREVAAERARWREALDDDRDDVARQLEREAGDVLYAAVAKALGDLAGLDDGALERRVLATFGQRLAGLEGDAANEVRTALERAGALTVTTTRPVDEADRGALLDAVTHVLGASPEVRFETDPDLRLGVSLAAGAYRIGWNLTHYLDDVTAGFARALEAQAASPRAPDPAPDASPDATPDGASVAEAPPASAST